MIEKDEDDTVNESGALSLVVKSAVKRYLADEHGIRVGSGFMAALDEGVLSILSRAAKRCRDNGRATVRPSDI